MLLFALTIFLSAFLLFQVQPMIAKMILPWFGGSAAVWSASLLFFQTLLLAGYAYAHWIIEKLSARAQMALHGTLLALSLFLLPAIPSARFKPAEAGDPTFLILLLLTATIGLPYLILSSTSPLLQAWYVRTKGGAMPYRLFALSNFGSMIALLSYPLVVEPRMAARSQALTWSAGYAVFALLCGAAAWKGRKGPSVSAPAESAVAPKPALPSLALWTALAACASILLVAVTNHLTQNVAPIPLLWVVPLTVYLLSFILSFESDRIYHRGVFIPLALAGLGGMAFMIHHGSGNPEMKLAIPVYVGGLFAASMMCHGELARRKPDPRHLTVFYLTVSLGGALGGLFVALVAPRIFREYFELPVGLALCGALIAIVTWPQVRVREWTLAAAVTLTTYLGWREYRNAQGYRMIERNFYGVLKVYDESVGEENAERVLTHGTIQHGSQLLAPERRREVTAYYGETSGIGRAIRAMEANGPVKIGVIGLGAGVLSAYGRAGDIYRIYEINPMVERIANTEFSFLPESRADKRVLLGDARLVLEAQENQQFDALAVDAFSSDAIPVHLLTREALQLYARHLKPSGVLALHVSNRYLDLVPVAAQGASAIGFKAVVVDDDPEDGHLSSSTWVLLAKDGKVFQAPAFEGADVTDAVAKPGLRPWTDDYSNLIQILK